MARRRTGGSLVAEAYDRLRREVLQGTFAPGQRLLLSDLATEHGVSLSVIREAVTRLASEQLLEATPQQGFRVRRLAVDDLEDLVWLRVALETLALREAIAHGDLAWEAQLVAAHHALSRTPMTLQNPDWFAAHSAFHAALVAGSGRKRLMHMRQQLFDAAELYRYWASAIASDAAQPQVVAEHAAILEATLARDADRAAGLIARHISHTADYLKQLAPELATSEPSEP